jgi:SAM-dependent methyltransferase
MVTAIEPRTETPAALDPESPSDAPDLATARDALADEWRAANPQTPEQIDQFYRHAKAYGPDLDAWHATPERQFVTESIVHVAREHNVKRVVDIGCGAGHDLLALREALADAALFGVDPNSELTVHLFKYHFTHRIEHALVVDVAPIESADMLICIDVLEHLPDPEAFLSSIAIRAPLGCILFEMTACEDGSTPLHLASNRGWRPGRCLEQHGWQLVGERGRTHVWQRTAETRVERATMLLCAYRNVTVQALQCVMAATAGDAGRWRLRVKTGDALISRSRSIILTAWHRETADEVCLMVDDDLAFTPEAADHITELCRAGRDIVVGGYPTHNGSHIACRFPPGVREITIGPDQPPMEITYGATGFMAISRRVIDALVADMPLCHAWEPWSFYNLFPTLVVPTLDGEGHELLSEDYGFCELARRAGFHIWLDATVKLEHASTIPIGIGNMAAIHQALHP